MQNLQFHGNKTVLKLYFPYNKELIEKIRNIPGVMWSNSMKCWYVPDTSTVLMHLHKLEGVTVTIENSANLFKQSQEVLSTKNKLLIIRYHKGRVRLLF